MTFPGAIHFRDKVDEVDGCLFMHELVHLKQMHEQGAIRFYLQYLYEYLMGLWKYRSHEQAYMNISFEKEAYKLIGEPSRE